MISMIFELGEIVYRNKITFYTIEESVIQSLHTNTAIETCTKFTFVAGMRIYYNVDIVSKKV